MSAHKRNNSKLISIISFVIIIFLISFTLYTIQKSKDEAKSLEPININLLTSVHPNLPWTFKAIQPKVITSPGEVISIEYQVENNSDKETTGIATFSYYPKSLEPYISKLNCFCYDAKALGPNEKDKYSVVLLLDPKVTKDSKTKNIKEVTIQFIFFDYKNYKKAKN
jgi:cytochrome c oxidase assembly protein Cox11